MKKLILILAIVFSGMLMQAQELNENAKFIKEEMSGLYKSIKTLVARDWESDHEMMVFGINEQSNAMFELAELSKEVFFDKEIEKKAVLAWSYTIKGINCSDYVMIVFEYKNQLKAKNNY